MTTPLFPRGTAAREIISQVVPAWRLVEKRALRFSADPEAVKRLLLRAASTAPPDARRHLKAAKWDPDALALLGTGGVAVLWKVRLNPNLEPQDGNEQHAEGTAVLVRMPIPGQKG